MGEIATTLRVVSKKMVEWLKVHARTVQEVIQQTSIIQTNL